MFKFWLSNQKIFISNKIKKRFEIHFLFMILHILDSTKVTRKDLNITKNDALRITKTQSIKCNSCKNI